jgi:hypothetical protein
MAAPKSSGLLAIMGGGGEEEASSDPMAEKEAAVREFFAAGKRGDWAGAASAFQDAYDACAMAHGGGEDVEEDDFELEED